MLHAFLLNALFSKSTVIKQLVWTDAVSSWLATKIRHFCKKILIDFKLMYLSPKVMLHTLFHQFTKKYLISLQIEERLIVICFFLRFY